MTRSYRNSTGGKRRRRKRRVKQRHRDAKRFHVRRGSEPMEFWRAHRGCVDKTRFYSAKLARKAAEELGLKPYRCTFCGHWHLTSKGSPRRGALPGADPSNSGGPAPGRDSRRGKEET